jgi:hypothetical protein
MCTAALCLCHFLVFNFALTTRSVTHGPLAGPLSAPYTAQIFLICAIHPSATPATVVGITVAKLIDMFSVLEDIGACAKLAFGLWQLGWSKAKNACMLLQTHN